VLRLLELRHLEDQLPELHHLGDHLLELRHLERPLLELHHLEGLLLELRHLGDHLLELHHLEARHLELRHSEGHHWVVRHSEDHWAGHLEGLLLVQELERVQRVLRMAFQRLEGLRQLQLRLRYQTLLLVCEGNLIVLCQSRLRFQQSI
jgi:hypothetical protein